MFHTNENPPAGGADGLDDAFPGGNCVHANAPSPAIVQAGITRFEREVAAEESRSAAEASARAASVKLGHVADDLALGDVEGALLNRRKAREHLSECASAFEEMQQALAAVADSIRAEAVR
jgi:hypothetical protein